MPVTWDDAKEKQLLLSIIHFTSPSPPWAEVAKSMGEECSEEACKQKLKKLKAAAKSEFGDAPTNEDGTPKTPAKRGGGKKKAAVDGEGGSATKSTGKRKAKAKAGADEEGEGETPTKKVKSESASEDSAGAEEKAEGEAAGED